ncbi:hypothetical protein [Pseudocnuella soli]|uniref:hypothetical protein n=1 Tax=Pseudocnuella soli TaxID=2502779 RepID=UPI00104F9507|nr:hypothetical protein [Pseudocnuella soli]
MKESDVQETTPLYNEHCLPGNDSGSTDAYENILVSFSLFCRLFGFFPARFSSFQKGFIRALRRMYPIRGKISIRVNIRSISFNNHRT